MPAVRRITRLFFGLASALLVTACGSIFAPPPSPTAPLTETATASPTATPTATATPSPTATATATPTPTPTPALIGTPFSADPQGIIELTLPRVVELARWGRGTSSDLAWSPDGAWLAVASRLGVLLYDAETLEELQRLPAWEVRRVAFSPDGQRLASAGQTLDVWDLATFERLVSLPSPASEDALDLRYSADGQELGLVGRNATGDKVLFERLDAAGENMTGSATIGGTGSRISTAALSPDLSLVAAHGRGRVQLFRTRDGASLTTLPVSMEAPGPLAFAPDGQSLAVGYPDQRRDYLNQNSIIVYRVPDGSLAYILSAGGGVEGLTEPLLSLSFSPDGQSVAGGFANQVVRVWASAGGPPRRTLNGAAAAEQVVFSPGSERVASNAIDVWEVSTGKAVVSAPQHFEVFQDLTLSPDGKLAALAGYSHIELRSLADGSLVREILGLPGPVRALSFYPGGQTIAAACGDGLVRLYRVSDGRFLSTLGEIGPPLWAVAFSPDANWLIWGGEGQRIFLYDLVRDTLVDSFAEPYVPTHLAFSPDSALIASLTSSGVNIRGLDGVLVRNSGGTGLEDMAFWLDGSQFALVGNEVARVVDTSTGKDLALLDFRADDTPTAVTYSPDGAFLAVGWASGHIELYWAGTKERLLTLEGHHGAVRRIVFTAGSRLMLSSGQDGTVRVWGAMP